MSYQQGSQPQWPPQQPQQPQTWYPPNPEWPPSQTGNISPQPPPFNSQQPQSNPGQFQPPPYNNPQSYMSSGQFQPPPFYNQPTQLAPGQFQPPYPPPTQPPRKRRNRFWLILGIIGGILLFSCVVCSVVGALTPSAKTAAVPTPTQATPTDTPTPTPSPTPSPTPTPLPPGTGDHMSLGSAYHNDPTNGFTITHPKDTFSSKDQMAYVATIDQTLNSFHLTLAVIQIDSNGGGSVVSSFPFTVSDTKPGQLANQFPILDIMGTDMRGKYRLQIENDSTILAHADFTYTA